MNKRIGFACKFLLDTSDKKSKELILEEKKYNTSSTTVKWLNQQDIKVAESRLLSVAEHNLSSVMNILKYLSTKPVIERMLRISSDILPMYTENKWKYIWQSHDNKLWYSQEFAKIGEFARKHDIRLSFHPGQFCVLASDRPDVVTKSIEELEYHATMATLMGYGNSWHDHGFKINVHISGKQGSDGIIKIIPLLSDAARNLVTFENDEMTWGIDECLKIANNFPIVLDIHHHLLYSRGEYIQPHDDRVKTVVASWRNVRPVIHYSVSKQDVIAGDPTILPDVKNILTNTSKTKLRAHSDDVWNSATNEWALQFLDLADIMVEAKWKNIASSNLIRHIK